MHAKLHISAVGLYLIPNNTSGDLYYRVYIKVEK